MSVCSGWNVQEMKAVKPPVSSCKLAHPLQMLDPLGQRLDVAEHHRGRRPAAQLVPDAVDVEPVVGQHLAAGDRLADAIDQDLGPAAGQAAQAGRLQPLEHRPQRQLGDLGEVVDLRRAEAVDVDLREVRLDVAEQLLVPLERQVRDAARLASGSGRRPARPSRRIFSSSTSRSRT